MLKSVNAAGSFSMITLNIGNALSRFVLSAREARISNSQRKNIDQFGTYILQKKTEIPRLSLERTPDIQETLLLQVWYLAVPRREQTRARKSVTFPAIRLSHSVWWSPRAKKTNRCVTHDLQFVRVLPSLSAQGSDRRKARLGSNQTRSRGCGIFRMPSPERKNLDAGVLRCSNVGQCREKMSWLAP